MADGNINIVFDQFFGVMKQHIVTLHCTVNCKADSGPGLQLKWRVLTVECNALLLSGAVAGGWRGDGVETRQLHISQTQSAVYTYTAPCPSLKPGHNYGAACSPC